MGKWLIPAPVLPGKQGMIPTITKYLRDHMSEYEQSRARTGLTLERVYSMQTPQGLLIIAYQEGTHDFAKTNELFATSDLAIDKWTFDTLKEVHGIDFRNPPAGPPPEVLFDWVDPQVKERKRGLAFASPVVPGKTDAGRAFSVEAFTRRASELAGARRKVGGTREFGMLHHTPMGDVASVYIEGDDPAATNARFARSTDSFDVWFKKQAGEILGQDFNQPLPPIEQIFEYQRAGVPA